MPEAKSKKPKKIVGGRRKPSRIVVPPMNPNNPYKLRTTVGVPGGVGHLRLTIRSY
jgi:hypothetical protein